MVWGDLAFHAPHHPLVDGVACTRPAMKRKVSENLEEKKLASKESRFWTPRTFINNNNNNRQLGNLQVKLQTRSGQNQFKLVCGNTLAAARKQKAAGSKRATSKVHENVQNITKSHWRSGHPLTLVLFSWGVPRYWV